ncbi:metalloregulator ArsR/SmtB family transcription factor [Shewanella sp. VB17]|uniref:metalloregulator ArsR/SmtB family transcription factor n=1 Tax=Shewanella sp. VB17 TaxID=2739432 RepID=UPI0015658393|nr:metalloregulator ArsR/SmtB family transcription factor [Shewanella sp. VB17]NRD75329.1 metalloregulator ArsR/SmtB family transcription factor [Shewanella sp. VB17]
MTALDLFKTLSDETRLRSLLLIHAEQELCVCELMQALEESQPKVSRHLALLRKVGLLHDKRQGQWVFYRVNPNLPTWMHQVINATYLANGDLIALNLARLKLMGDRPNRVKICCD